MKKYDVFISYSRKDYVDEKRNVIPDNVVSKIKDALSSAEITYWFDEDGIDHGDDFADKIVANIEASEIFVFLSTINSNSSPWTRKEIACAHEMDKKIIPVRIDASKHEFEDMLNMCICRDTMLSGTKGLIVTGPNGNQIFLPAAGYREGSVPMHKGERGYYWSSLSSNWPYCLEFDSGSQYVNHGTSFHGYSVRPITE